MQAVDADTAAMLATSIRAPKVYAWIQYPLVVDATANTYDFDKLGSQLVINTFTAVRRVNVLDTGADTCDLELQGNVATYSPLSSTSSYGRYLAPGAIDIKYQLFLGVAVNGEETIFPKGVYVSESTNLDSQSGVAKIQLNLMDQFSLFRGDIYTSFPPRLYGGQLSAYYNPNYAFTTNDQKTYICDGRFWMTNENDFPLWASDFPNQSSGDGSTINGYALYLSSYQNGMTPLVPAGLAGHYPAFTVNTIEGTVTFNSALDPTAIVSADCRPLAMLPELAMYHLLVDFGSWNPEFLKLDCTGACVPLMELSRDRAMLDCAQDLITLVAPHGLRWSLYIDEVGNICLTELSPEGTAVKTFIDTKDILHVTPEFSAGTIYNVVRASGVLQNNNPIESISYDLYSISTFGQKPTYDLPSQMTDVTKGMDVGSGASFLNGLTESILFEYSRPSVVMDIEILADPTLQVGDPVNIIESTTGINNRFYIKQITDEIQGVDWKQTLRVERQQMSQDWNWGLAANLGVGQTQNANAIQLQSGFITDVWLQNHNLTDKLHVVTNGQPLLDASYQPVLFDWLGDGLDINVTLGNVPTLQNGQGTFTMWMFRWIYIGEDAYVYDNTTTAPNGVLTGGGIYKTASQYNWTPGSSAAINDLHGLVTTDRLGKPIHTLPYDVRADIDTNAARKYWRPLLRCPSWLSDDGQTPIVIAPGHTQSFLDTFQGGPGLQSGTYSAWNAYGNLVIGKNDFFSDQTAGFVGQQLYAAGTPAASFLGSTSTIKYGMDFGTSFLKLPVFYGIRSDATPCYLNIFIMTNAGTMQYKKIPFLLSF